jgi:hypothetical protein
MNFFTKLLLLWYVFITTLSIISATTLSLSSVAYGLILMWFVFFIFVIGNVNVNLKMKIYNKPKLDYASLYSDYAINIKLIIPFSFICSFYAASFYTGKSPTEVAVGLSLGKSLYNDYQQYFAQNSLGVFSVSKLPAVFSVFYVKFISVYSFFLLIVFPKAITKRNILFFFLAALPSFYFSISRGTSFEFFEFIIMIWFGMSVRNSLSNDSGRKVKLITRSNIILVLLVIAAVTAYNYNISARYGFKEVAECVTSDLCLDKDTVLYDISPGLASLTLKMSGYFVFGLYFTSVLIENYVLVSFDKLFFWLFPSIISDGYPFDVKSPCNQFLDCGAAWIPDFVIFTFSYGFVSFCSFIFLIGRLVSILFSMSPSRLDIHKFVVIYLIFVGLTSIPVGNFLTSSSANKMLLCFSFLLYFGFYIARGIKIVQR